MIARPDLIETGLALPCAALRCMLGLIMLRAAWQKSRDLAVTGEMIAAYRLLPTPLASPAGLLLTLAELVLGMLLLAGLERVAVAIATSCLLALFVAAMGINLLRGRRDISCGCLPRSARGSAAGDRLSWEKLCLTASLIPLAALAAFAPPPAASWAGAQAMLAGLLLASLHDSLLRLGLTRQVARVRR